MTEYLTHAETWVFMTHQEQKTWWESDAYKDKLRSGIHEVLTDGFLPEGTTARIVTHDDGYDIAVFDLPKGDAFSIHPWLASIYGWAGHHMVCPDKSVIDAASYEYKCVYKTLSEELRYWRANKMRLIEYFEMEARSCSDRDSARHRKAMYLVAAEMLQNDCL